MCVLLREAIEYHRTYYTRVRARTHSTNERQRVMKCYDKYVRQRSYDWVMKQMFWNVMASYEIDARVMKNYEWRLWLIYEIYDREVMIELWKLWWKSYEKFWKVMIFINFHNISYQMFAVLVHIKRNTMNSNATPNTQCNTNILLLTKEEAHGLVVYFQSYINR